MSMEKWRKKGKNKQKLKKRKKKVRQAKEDPNFIPRNPRMSHIEIRAEIFGRTKLRFASSSVCQMMCK
ncbi:hypothetical protein ES288_A11G229200v1 [Gossypium darwinii]|uniref:Uncharacterized protein n=1 Tax=Gossypium darwinii TaxID=34276 RepID=A0A5D2EP00_GOSDA|nr:hypothetical protein ES288_A11G229200v1 [Gossypium darwinii]